MSYVSKPRYQKLEEKLLKFSCSVNFLCRFSDPFEPVHYLTWRYSTSRGYLRSICIICKSDELCKYYFHCDTCDFDVHKHCYVAPRCRMSLDLEKPHTLQKMFGKISFCSACQQSRSDFHWRPRYYHCATCNVDFHKGCHLYLPEITHPFHPFHPLKLFFSSNHSYSDLYSYLTRPSLLETSYPKIEPDKPDDASISDVQCKCCQKNLHNMYYHCSACNFSLNLTCTRYPPPLAITNIKSHYHPLTLFPRRIPLPCDACGLSLNNAEDHVYTCHPCDYMVHRTCIYLPRVIKITRHQHRLSLSSSLPPGVFICGVCRRTINVTYGQFSCSKGCHYAVHSKCAVEGRVWDGIDLEGVPEDPEEDIEPFVRIDDKTIQHFSHKHYLRLHKENDLCDEDRFCQACILSVLKSESFYSCVECVFFLHEGCASLPRKKDHHLHKHPLILHPVPPMSMQYERRAGPSRSYTFTLQGIFRCNGCDQIGCGFMYKCKKEDCKFKLDIRCASLPDPISHGSHSHDLFFNFTQGQCMGCKSSKCSPFSLECMQCKSFLGLKCASLPSLINYKHDKHPLSLCYGEKGRRNGQYWCEICESKLDAKQWFYKCDHYCNVTVHINCLLGKDRFMKPMSLKKQHGTVQVLRNNGNTKIICKECRCTDPFRFNTGDDYCSLHCLVGKLF